MTRRRKPPRVRAWLQPCPDCAAEFEGTQLVHEPTCPMARGVDEVCDRDREFFEQHPHEQYFTRPMAPAERQTMAHIDPAGAAASHVHVLRVPGGRVRQFCSGEHFAAMAIDPDDEVAS